VKKSRRRPEAERGGVRRERPTSRIRGAIRRGGLTKHHAAATGRSQQGFRSQALRIALASALLLVAARAETLVGPECAVFFAPDAKPKAERVVATFGTRRDHAARWLGLAPSGRAEVHLVPDLAAMRVLAPGAPSWSVAVTSGDRMVFRLDLVDHGAANSLDLVLKHECVHFALNRTRARLPRWFEEGLAAHHAGLPYLEPDTTVERAASAGRLPRLAEADRLFDGGERDAALGYKLGQRAAGVFVRRFGDAAIARLVQASAEGAAFPDAFASAAGESLDDFERGLFEEVTPPLPFWLFVVVENLELSLLTLAALLAAAGYLRWRLRRERAMSALGRGDEPPA